ncbi:MAG: hypothetical protein FWC78_05760 [Defluviitaleaceae bacterium]|nr:hypothetical protein [Defluviitaleaceae bacterium]
MKQHYIPLKKQSKRKQKEFHQTQRRDWGGFNPITRKTENGKAYNRKKSKRWDVEHDPRLDFFMPAGRLPAFLHSC